MFRNKNAQKCQKYRAKVRDNFEYKKKNIDRKKRNLEREKSFDEMQHVAELRQIGHRLEYLKKYVSEVQRSEEFSELLKHREILKTNRRNRLVLSKVQNCVNNDLGKSAFSAVGGVHSTVDGGKLF